MCGSQRGDHRAGLDGLALGDDQGRPVLDRIAFQLDVLRAEDLDFAAAGEGHQRLGVLVPKLDRVDVAELDDTGLLGLDLAFLDLALGHAADVESPHRQLRARLADRLGGDDADRHPLFHHRAGRQVHAVAQAADAERGLAGHRAADDDLVDVELLDFVGPFPGVIISFSATITSPLTVEIGLRATRPRIDSARLRSTSSPL